MRVCLTVSTFRGIVAAASHYYGTLREYENGEAEEVEVTQVMSEEQAAELNRIERMSDDHVAAYRAGERTSRFENEKVFLEAALRIAVEKWGEDVEVYRGNRAALIEDLERLR